MRGVAAISVYVYGETEEELKKEAEKLASILREHDDNHAKVDCLYEAPLAKIGDLREIKL